MSNTNQTIVIGNLTRDFELKYTAGGKAVASSSIAHNTRRKGAGGDWEDGPSSFFNVTAWEQLAENVTESLFKGMRVMAIGEMRQRSWEDDDGTKRTAWDLILDSCGPDLRWATCDVTKNDRPSSGGGGGQQSKGSPSAEPGEEPW